MQQRIFYDHEQYFNYVLQFAHKKNERSRDRGRQYVTLNSIAKWTGTPEVELITKCKRQIGTDGHAHSRHQKTWHLEI